jgi:hypothetical protein
VAAVTPRWIRLGDATSQWLNVLIFNGDPNHSVSGDAYRYNRVKLRRFIDILFAPFEEDHCRKAYENDVSKARYLLAENGIGTWRN